MKINKLLLVSVLLAMPVLAAEGVPGATISNDGARPAPGGRTVQHEACTGTPEKCRQERTARREKMCADNPEKCKEMKAKMEQRRSQCQADPEKCRQQHQARAAEHFRKADADGNGTLSRTEAEKGAPRLARRFDAIDANKDGQLSREEMEAARKARHGTKAPVK